MRQNSPFFLTVIAASFDCVLSQWGQPVEQPSDKFCRLALSLSVNAPPGSEPVTTPTESCAYVDTTEDTTAVPINRIVEYLFRLSLSQYYN